MAKTAGGSPKTEQTRYAFIGPAGVSYALDAAKDLLKTRSRGKTILVLVVAALEAMAIPIGAERTARPDVRGRPKDSEVGFRTEILRKLTGGGAPAPIPDGFRADKRLLTGRKKRPKKPASKTKRGRAV